jgi:dsDNA-specific endonuclease/ATPase MutS2
MNNEEIPEEQGAVNRVVFFLVAKGCQSYGDRIAEIYSAQNKKLSEKEAEIQRLKEYEKVWEENNKLYEEAQKEIQQLKEDRATVVGEAFEKGAEAQYVCMNLTTMATDDERFDKMKAEYLKQFQP